MEHFIIGTDWWDDCDDAVALRLAAREHKKGNIVIDGIAINACMEYSAASLAVFMRSEGLCPRIGLDRSAVDCGGNPSYQKRLALSSDIGFTNAEAEEPVKMYRQLLSSSDEKLSIAEIGFPQILAALLKSPPDSISSLSGYELIKLKVRKLWLMAGRWDVDGGKENNICRTTASRNAAAEIFDKWPTSVTCLGWEVGASVITGNRLSQGDILKQILTDHGHPDGRSSWDPMLILLAITGDESLAGYSYAEGKASVDASDGANHFSAFPGGSHRYVKKACPDSYYAEEINSRIG